MQMLQVTNDSGCTSRSSPCYDAVGTLHSVVCSSRAASDPTTAMTWFAQAVRNDAHHYLNLLFVQLSHVCALRTSVENENCPAALELCSVHIVHFTHFT